MSKTPSFASPASPLPPPATLPSAPAAGPDGERPSAVDWPYVYVATPAELDVLLSAIRAMPAPEPSAVLQLPHVYLDTEGLELGTSVGKLSIVQLGLPSAGAAKGVSVYLVDILALPAAALRGLWDVLEDDALAKVVWDGKQDFAELYHSHGVTLRQVLDLQIAELLGRVRAAEREREKTGREQTPGWVWSLGGMKRSVDEFEAFRVEERDEAERLFLAVRAKFEAGGSSAWMDRPLTDELLRYAALDIYKLTSLFPLFHLPRPVPALSTPPAATPTGRPAPATTPPDDPLITRATLPAILAVSARNLVVHQPERRAPDDVYHQHAFLPSEVLAEGVGPARESPCPGCQRTLKESSWQIPQSRVCMVCWAVEKRLSKKRGGVKGVFSPGLPRPG